MLVVDVGIWHLYDYDDIQVAYISVCSIYIRSLLNFNAYTTNL